MGACFCSGSKHQDGLAGEEETCTLVRRSEHRSSDRVRGQGNVQRTHGCGYASESDSRDVCIRWWTSIPIQFVTPHGTQEYPSP